MTRPTEDEIKIALLVARTGAAIGPNVACVLAAEVTALQDDIRLVRIERQNLWAELQEARAALQTTREAVRRVEALCGACQGGPHHVIGQQFSKALRGGQ